MEKGNLNTGDQSAYKITSHEKCRFHETTTTAGPGKWIMSVRPWPVEFEMSLYRLALTVGHPQLARSRLPLCMLRQVLSGYSSCLACRAVALSLSLFFFFLLCHVTCSDWVSQGGPFRCKHTSANLGAVYGFLMSLRYLIVLTYFKAYWMPYTVPLPSF